jgi:hypothetical protein
LPARSAQFWAREVRHLQRNRKVKDSLDYLHFALTNLKPSQEHLEQIAWHLSANLEAHHAAEPPLAEPFFDRLKEVVCLLLYGVEVSVARHAKEVCVKDLGARKEEVKVGEDQLF